MAWTNGGPGSKIPQWVKRTVNARQHDMCITIDRTVCWGTIDEYDHIINVKSTGKQRHELNNPDLIQGLCRPCHRLKTQAEARQARNRWKRKPEPHPGLHHDKHAGQRGGGGAPMSVKAGGELARADEAVFLTMHHVRVSLGYNGFVVKPSAVRPTRHDELRDGIPVDGFVSNERRVLFHKQKQGSDYVVQNMPQHAHLVPMFVEHVRYAWTPARIMIGFPKDPPDRFLVIRSPGFLFFPYPVEQQKQFSRRQMMPDAGYGFIEDVRVWVGRYRRHRNHHSDAHGSLSTRICGPMPG